MEIREYIPLAPLTTLRVGGAARYFVEAMTDSDIAEAMIFAHAHALPTFILGGGSNVLIADEGFSGLVIKMVSKQIEWIPSGATVRVVANAGVAWDRLVGECVSRGYWGLENLSGIPGSVGAAPVQNIGAYGVEVAELIEWVEVYDPLLKKVRTITKEECVFGYRMSLFKQQKENPMVILRVAFRLANDGMPKRTYKDLAEYHEKIKPLISPTDVREAVLAIRGRKFPDLRIVGTAGSFFKNPIVDAAQAEEFLARYPLAPHYSIDGTMTKLSAAWIIDHVLQMRGVREGHVGTWGAQALVLITDLHASAYEVHAFAMQVIERCKADTNIFLEPEVVFIGMKEMKKNL